MGSRGGQTAQTPLYGALKLIGDLLQALLWRTLALYANSPEVVHDNQLQIGPLTAKRCTRKASGEAAARPIP